MKLKIVLLTALLSANLSALNVGEVPKVVSLSGEKGGKALDNSAWSSGSIKDKVFVMFYVDPDEKSLNEEFSQMLQEKKYDRAKYGSIAIVNLAATWKPNIVIEKILKSKQKEFPDTIYVKDKESVLVNEWKIADNNSDVIVFNKNGKVLYYKVGKLDDKEREEVFALIEKFL